MLAVLLALAVAPLTVARAVGGGTGTPVVQIAAFTPWALLGWAVVAVLFVLVRWWRFAVVSLLVLAVHVWWVAPPSAARQLAAARADRPGVPIRVLTVNAEYGQADAATIARTVAEGRVDLVAVQELTEPLAAELDRTIGGTLPHRDLHPSRWLSARGTGVWSRFPVRPVELLRMRFANPRMVVQVPGAPEVTLTAVHTQSPTPDKVPAWRADLGLLATTVRGTEGPQLLLGDFNASRDHEPFRGVLGSGVVDAADALGGLPRPGFTWPADRRRAPAATRIDHVLVTPAHFRVAAVTTLPVPGTDHRAVMADLVLPPPRSP